MEALAVPYLAAAALLVVAGAQKARDPKPLVRALRSAGLPAPRPLVRLVAAAELALGLAALGGLPVGLAVAASYAAFTGFVVLALARGGVLSSCGCFGKDDVPPTRTHAVVTAGLALASGLAGSAALTPAVAVVALVVAATAYLVLAELPLLQAASLRTSTRAAA